MQLTKSILIMLLTWKKVGRKNVSLSPQQKRLIVQRILFFFFVFTLVTCIILSSVTAVVFYKNPSVKKDFQLAFSNFFVAISEMIKPAPEKIPVETADEDKPAEIELPTLENLTYVLIMGVDEREDDFGRSDTIMVAQLDSTNDRLALLSIPRDTRVLIRGGYDKINAAYAYGGISLAKQTVEDFLDLEIDHYVIFNTSGLIKMLDAMGGIDIDVEKRMFYEDPWDDNGGLYIDLRPGLQHMDGKTAMTYVRFRDWEGDIGRVRRQQKFMHAVMEKIQSPQIVPRIPSLAAEVYRAVKTDLSVREILAIAGTVRNSREGSNFTTGVIEGDWQYLGDVSYLIPNEYSVDKVVSKTFQLPMKNLDSDYLTEEYFDEFFLDEVEESTIEQDEEESEFNDEFETRYYEPAEGEEVVYP